jgi:hypothetical protein
LTLGGIVIIQPRNAATANIPPMRRSGGHNLTCCFSIFAADAISTGSVLVTNNSDDLRDIPELSIETWAIGR